MVIVVSYFDELSLQLYIYMFRKDLYECIHSVFRYFIRQNDCSEYTSAVTIALGKYNLFQNG